MELEHSQIRSINIPPCLRDLREIVRMPNKLYIKGNYTEELDGNAFAIVGSRNLSEKGKQNAFEFAKMLAKNRVTVVSGLAIGADSCAHQGALAGGGRTLAVLPCGLNHVYPPGNFVLAEKVARRGGLISEYDPDVEWSKGRLIERDELVSALGPSGLLVIEARRKRDDEGKVISGSGTQITVRNALDQGRSVYVIRGSEITDELADQGATVVEYPADILQYVI